MKESSYKESTLYPWLLAMLLILTFTLAKAQGNVKKVDAQKAEYTSQLLRDPFISSFETAVNIPPKDDYLPPQRVNLPHLQVQGMVWNSANPQAIINNKVVRVGEVIGNTEILSITREGIEVLFEGKQYILGTMLPKKK